MFVKTKGAGNKRRHGFTRAVTDKLHQWCNQRLEILHICLKAAAAGGLLMFALKVFPVVLLWAALMLPNPWRALLMWGFIGTLLLVAPAGPLTS